MRSPREWSTGRILATFLGGLLLLAAAVQLLEGFVTTEAPEVSDVAGAAGEPPCPLVRRVGDDSVAIEIGGRQESVITIKEVDPAEIQALEVCLREGLERAFPECPGDGDSSTSGSASLFGRQAERLRVAREADRVMQSCLAELSGFRFPELPALPEE